MSDVKPDKSPSFLYDFGRIIPALDDIRVGMHDLLNERDQLRAELATLRESEESAQHAAKRAVDELAKLQAEREPRDNGDGTVTAMLPVTHPAGLDVVEVREPRIGDEFISDIGERMTCTFSPRNEGRVRLILRPAPKPPEPATWEAPLADGEWEASLSGAENDTVLFQWSYWGTLLHGLAKPAKLGKYRFKDGVGTLIQEAGNE